MSWMYCGQARDRRTGRARDIGYGVSATCDEEGCRARIDRGLSYVCGGMHNGGDHGCGGYYCEKHLFMGKDHQLCTRCWDAAPIPEWWDDNDPHQG